MYCERCGAELDEDARFCERCGQPAMEAPRPVGEMPGEAPCAVAAEHVPVPAAVPAPAPAAPVSESQAAETGTPVTRRRRRLVAVAAACGVALIALVIAAGVLVAGMTKGGTDAPGQEGTSETSDPRQKDDAKSEVASPVDADADADTDPHGDGQGEEPATEEKPVGEAVAPASPQIPDLANDDDRYRLTKFLSNFSEAGLWVGYGEEDARQVMRFDRNEPEFARMAMFLFLNSHQNGGALIDYDKLGFGGGCYLMQWSSVSYMTNLFFGREYPHDAFPVGESRYPDRVDEGLLFYTTAPTEQYGPTAPLSVEDAGTGLIRVRFDTYGLPLFDQGMGASPYGRIRSEEIEYGDQAYRVRAADMCSYLGVDEPSTSGTALLECERDGDGWSFHLVSYELDGPCLSRP